MGRWPLDWRNAKACRSFSVDGHTYGRQSGSDLHLHVRRARNLKEGSSDFVRGFAHRVEVFPVHFDGDVALDARNEVIDPHLDWLTQAVKDGKISQAQADQSIATMKANLTTLIAGQRCS